MGSLQWVLLALLIMIGLAYWNYQRIDDQRKALQTAGFQVSDDLKGSPPLLVSSSQRQIAVLQPSGYVRFDFDQLQQFEVRSNSGAESESHFRIALGLSGMTVAEIEVGYENEHRAAIALKQLRQLTDH
ncbi:hypothetical protein Q4488_13700 [Amphritea sp. 1_MG-2023]|nr:hypothetical protein [Amphritea sp. 1_MG-2023]